MEATFAALTPAQKEAFLNGPALKPPPGVMPNFTDPPTQRTLCIALAIVNISLATIFVGMRLYTKVFCVRKMRVEDYLTIASLILYAAFIYICIKCFIFPGGFIHQWNIRVKDTPGFLKDINEASILYGVGMTILKVCILLDWIHIFVPARATNRPFYYACVSNIAVNIIFYTILVFLELFACSPREKIWNVLMHGKCVIDVNHVIVASSVFNFVVDIVMLAMPQSIVWRLAVPIRKKVAISVIFAVGILACVCGALRIVCSVPWMNSPDKSYWVTFFTLAALGEMTAGFLVLCIPSIPKLVKSSPMLRTLFSSRDEKPNSRLGLPSWIKAGGQRQEKRRGLGYSGIDDDLTTMRTTMTTTTATHESSSSSEREREVPEFITTCQV